MFVVDAAPAFAQQTPDRLRVLFLGDNGHHEPARRAFQILPYMADRGIHVVYTDHLDALNPETLSQYHVLMLYGNNPHISREQEQALLSFVYEGGGLAPVHAGIAMFANSDAFVSLTGGTFKSHGEDVFTTTFVQPEHPVLKGLMPFESWDETYVHMRHNPDKTVLSIRATNEEEEPWTWVRDYGEGRVFYTAWGHDERTWSNPGFHQLLERGLRWAAGDWALDADWSPPVLTYTKGTIPFYPPGGGSGITGEPFTEVQEPLSPEASMDQTYVEPGFRLELFAAEPDVINPIDLDWDERGRLWITETVDYPNTIVLDRAGNDRIKILEDTDGDGRADKITVFADGLNIPTSIVLANGGAIVAQAPDMLFLKDEDGDDRADVKEVLFTGWGTYDTHAGPNNLRYGFDNHIWGAVGYSTFSGAVGGDSLLFAQALFRFATDGSSLEHMSTFSNNTWGLGISEDGLVFGSTANGRPSMFAAIPERFYTRFIEEQAHVLPMIADDAYIYPVRANVRQVDWHGLYTAGSGYEVYTARQFPKLYWNRMAFIGGPTGHLLGKYAHEADGSGFVARNEGSMIASRDEWFSPIQMRVGPDGALWIIDWYNIIIQHNPTPQGYERGEGNAYEIGLRDKQHSRIYRLVYEGAPLSSAMNLADASPVQLVEALTSDNMHWRLLAQRLLVERGEQTVLPALYALANNERVDEIGLNPGAIHALWTLHGLGVLDGANDEALAVALGALYHPSAAVQSAAVNVLPRTEATFDAILQAGILPDPEVPEEQMYTVPIGMMDAADGQTKIAALLAVADMPASPRAGRMLADFLSVSANANDSNLRDAATAAAIQHGTDFLKQMVGMGLSTAEDTSFASNMRHALTAVGRGYARNTPSSRVKEVLMSLREADEMAAAAVLEGLATGWPQGTAPAFTSEESVQLKELHGTLPGLAAEHLQKLVDHWGVGALH